MPNVDVPQFELVGPPCTKLGCSGVMVDHLSLKTHAFYRKCSECNREADHAIARDKLAWAIRTIARVLRMEKLS